MRLKPRSLFAGKRVQVSSDLTAWLSRLGHVTALGRREMGFTKRQVNIQAGRGLVLRSLQRLT